MPRARPCSSQGLKQPVAPELLGALQELSAGRGTVIAADRDLGH